MSTLPTTGSRTTEIQLDTVGLYLEHEGRVYRFRPKGDQRTRFTAGQRVPFIVHWDADQQGSSYAALIDPGAPRTEYWYYYGSEGMRQAAAAQMPPPGRTFALDYELIIFDMDGCLIGPAEGQWIHEDNQFCWLPGRLEMLRWLSANGVKLGIATNQGGVAFGYRTRVRVHQLANTVCRDAGIPEWAAEICFTHPKASIAQYRMEGDMRRKPNPGMLRTLIEAYAVMDNRRVLFVGDMDSDQEAAARAGVHFISADDFFEKL